MRLVNQKPHSQDTDRIQRFYLTTASTSKTVFEAVRQILNIYTVWGLWADYDMIMFKFSNFRCGNFSPRPAHAL